MKVIREGTSIKPGFPPRRQIVGDGQVVDEGPREPRRTLSDGTQIYPGHREIDPATGQQKGFIYLTPSPKALDAIADVVLRYKPKPKSEPAKRRKRRARKLAKL